MPAGSEAPDDDVGRRASLPAASLQLAAGRAAPRLVRDFTRGQQWGVDVARYGKPYVFARYAVAAKWVVHAGPFVDEAAAVAYIEGLAR